MFHYQRRPAACETPRMLGQSLTMSVHYTDPLRLGARIVDLGLDRGPDIPCGGVAGLRRLTTHTEHGPDSVPPIATGCTADNDYGGGAMAWNVSSGGVDYFNQLDIGREIVVDDLGSEFPFHESVSGDLPSPTSAYSLHISSSREPKEALCERNGELILPVTYIRIDIAIGLVSRRVFNSDVGRVSHHDRV